MDLVYLTQDRDRLRALVNAGMKHRVQKVRGISRQVENRLASQDGLCSMQ